MSPTPSAWVNESKKIIERQNEEGGARPFGELPKRGTMAVTRKKDSSQLDWHYKVPTEEELKDPYKCFPADMWPAYFQAAKEASNLPPRKKSDPDLLRIDVKKAACEDCILPYQLLMQRLGRCHPVEGATTPEDREGWLDD